MATNAYWREKIEKNYLGAIDFHYDEECRYRFSCDRVFNLMRYMDTEADWKKLNTDLEKILKAYASKYTRKPTDFTKINMELGNLRKNLRKEKPQKKLEEVSESSALAEVDELLAKLKAKTAFAAFVEANEKKMSLIAGGLLAALVVGAVYYGVNNWGTAAPPRTPYTGSGYDQQTQDNLRKAGAPYGKSAGEAGRTIENMLRNK
ncbi:hypothetical protein AGMMS49975_09690 [Clostridia bacterium]|nr:hypothetical protein AGMMS49975_09690 [Clostridia bacterium]